MQETNSFSPVATKLEDFEALGIYRGNDVLDAMEGQTLAPLWGFIKAIRDSAADSVELIPILSATAMSGGPIERDVYLRLQEEILDGIRDALPLDGVYLSLHGAMGVDGMRDPEGNLLEAVRRETGPQVPIAVSLDLHANITEAKVRNATVIVGYKTNPHRDFYATGFRCAEILLATLQGKIRPTMVAKKMRLLKGGGMTIDFLHPMRDVFAAMRRIENREDVLSVSNFMVHIWLDDPELGWCTVAVTDDNPDLAEEVATEIADLNWSVRSVAHSPGLTPSLAIGEARRSVLARLLGTVVICDAADAVGAGAPGESTWILKTLLEEAPDLVSYVPVRDAEAAARAYEADIDDTVGLWVGGKLDPEHNQPVYLDGRIRSKAITDLGKTVVVEYRGVHVVLTELPAMTMFPSFYTDLGLGLFRADIVVVKNLFPFRFTYAAYNRKTLDVLTAGTTNVDVFQIDYRHIPRPIYPLDDIADWDPEAAHSTSDAGLPR